MWIEIFNIFKKRKTKIEKELELLLSRKYPKYTKEDIDQFLRDLKIDQVIGDVNLTPDVSKLSPELIRKCQLLCGNYNMVVGGSVLLKACGLLEHRNTDDIDVFCSIKEAKEKGLIKKRNIINSSRQYKDNLERFKVRLPKLGKIDIFDQQMETTTDINGIKFGCPIITMEEKFRYFRQKDQMDLFYIKWTLGYENPPIAMQ